jgi:hypothetical protein
MLIAPRSEMMMMMMMEQARGDYRAWAEPKTL